MKVLKMMVSLRPKSEPGSRESNPRNRILVRPPENNQATPKQVMTKARGMIITQQQPKRRRCGGGAQETVFVGCVLAVESVKVEGVMKVKTKVWRMRFQERA
jgi:hypothetical protein